MDGGPAAGNEDGRNQKRISAMHRFQRRLSSDYGRCSGQYILMVYPVLLDTLNLSLTISTN